MSNALRPRPFGGPANQPWFDRYTSAHAGTGIAFAYYGLPWWALVGTSVGWELIENVLKDKVPSIFPYSSHDSLGNSIADSAAAIAAYFATRNALSRPDLDPRIRGAIAAGAAATVGGILGAAGFGVVGKLLAETQEGGTVANRFGSVGYHAGAAAGAGLGLMAARPDVVEQNTAVTAGGGAIGGPLGAVVAAYLGQVVRGAPG